MRAALDQKLQTWMSAAVFDKGTDSRQRRESAARLPLTFRKGGEEGWFGKLYFDAVSRDTNLAVVQS